MISASEELDMKSRGVARLLDEIERIKYDKERCAHSVARVMTYRACCDDMLGTRNSRACRLVRERVRRHIETTLDAELARAYDESPYVSRVSS